MGNDSLDSPQARQRQTVAAFNVYRTPGVAELLSDVQVSTWYRGVLVENAARVIETRADSVLFAVSAQLGGALEHAPCAYVESSLHGTCFKARVTGVHCGGEQVELSEFVPFKDYMERRERSRVTPVHAMLVRLTHGRFHLRGRVVDISVNALAALFEVRALERITPLQDVELDVWGEYDVTHPLPDFHASGKVLSVRPLHGDMEMACHVVVTLQSYPALDRVLKVYVARREREIMATLSDEDRERGDGRERANASGGQSVSAPVKPQAAPPPTSVL